MQTIVLIVALLYVVAVIGLANRLDRARQTRKEPAVLAYPYNVTEAPREIPDSTASPMEQNGGLKTLLLLALAGMVGVLILNSASIVLSVALPPEFFTQAELEPLEISVEAAFLMFGVSLVVGVVCLAIMFSRQLRQRLAAWLGGQALYNPDSYVHITAFVLSVVLLAYTILNVIMQGGVAGLAESLEQQEIGLADALINVMIMPTIALFGVGVLVRRSLGQALQRLGLRLPTQDDVLWGLGTAAACLVFIFTFAILLSLLLPEELLQEQGAASEQIALAFGGSFLLAFLTALSASVGEEILFRGALQPVFGLIPTTLFFALLHSQYALTPSSLAIVFVGGAFGWLKRRQSTTSAIIAHFIYNFVQLMMVALYLRLEEAGVLPQTSSVLLSSLAPFTVLFH